MPEINVTIEPSEKYHEVIHGYHEMAGPAWDEDTEANEETVEAAESYAETIEQTPTPDEMDMDESEMEPLSWDLFSVSKDPDLVSKMATYFEGMQPDEPTDLLRAKLRLLECETYANAQIAARSELSD